MADVYYFRNIPSLQMCGGRPNLVVGITLPNVSGSFSWFLEMLNKVFLVKDVL